MSIAHAHSLTVLTVLVPQRSYCQGKMAASPPALNGEDRSAQRTTSVSVDDSETWVESKRYTVYKVVVRKAERPYFVFRRYVRCTGVCIYTHESPAGTCFFTYTT